MNRRFTPRDHVLLLTKKLLGCENWEPPENLIVRLKEHLPLYFDRGIVHQKLQEWGERQALGHETRLIHVLSGSSPRTLAEDDIADLMTSFNCWWSSLGNGTSVSMTLSSFIEEWAISRGLYPSLGSLKTNR